MYTPQESDDLRKLGEHIREIRRKRGFSQESFAEVVGLHRTYMGGVERGERNISVLNLLKICRQLKIEPADLFREPCLDRKTVKER